MAPKPKCAHCKKTILEKHFLKCSQCKRSYDLACTNSEKLFSLMDKERKEVWTCIKCRQHKDQPGKTSTPKITKKVVAVASSSHQLKMTPGESRGETTYHKPLPNYEQEPRQQIDVQQQLYKNQQQALEQEQQLLNCSVNNITRRKYNVPVRNSFDSRSDEEFDISTRNDTLNRSCPNMTVNYKDEAEGLKNKIAELHEKLKFSDDYTTKLLMENDDLKKQIIECTRQINQLKNICKSTTPAAKTLTKQTKQESTQTGIDNGIDNQDANKSTDELNLECYEITTDNVQNNNKNGKKSQKNVHILGGRQSKGLAVALRNSRQNTAYEKYNVTSTVRPDARCEDILKTPQILSNYDDVFIINIGESDSNPIKLLAELGVFLKTYVKSFIIVIGVKTSMHLNERKLNYAMKLHCKSFENCAFLDVTEINNNHVNFLSKICHKINFLLDSRFYNKKYLNFNKLKLKMSSKKDELHYVATDNHHYHKGTIPYYFKKVEHNVSTLSTEKLKTVTQKSITAYFRQRDNKEKKETNNLFRS